MRAESRLLLDSACSAQPSLTACDASPPCGTRRCQRRARPRRWGTPSTHTGVLRALTPGYSEHSHRGTPSTHTGVLRALTPGYSEYSHRGTLSTHTGVPIAVSGVHVRAACDQRLRRLHVPEDQREMQRSLSAANDTLTCTPV